MNVAVLSDGAWGTALAMLLLDNGHQVTLWGPFPDYIEEMRRSRRNTRFLDLKPLPDSLRLTSDMQVAAGAAELIVLAAPAQFARGCMTTLAGVPGAAERVIVNVAKGIELETLQRMSQVAATVLAPRRYVALSGPSHAEEVCRGVPTAVVVASQDDEAAALARDAFMSEVFRVYTSNDVIGVELGGALKNVYAIAAGICDGMQLGDNSKAALMTRAIAEMARLGAALGGRPETFSGLSGIGDMIVTCCSGFSRNRHVGEELGKGRSLAEITAEMGLVVAEGVKTTQSAYDLAAANQVEAPIISEVYAGLYQDKDMRQGVRDLMTRPSRPELE